jgi:DNA-binding NarL/FixJ family response regulator
MSAVPARLRVVVADDQALVREGLMTLLDLAEEIELVGDAADGQQAVALAASLEPDVVLMDLRMPVMDGVEATGLIRAADPRIQVLVLTTHADEESVMAALHAGAIGYLTKDTGRHALVSAIQSAAAGNAVLDRKVQERLLAAASIPAARKDPLEGVAPIDAAPSPDRAPLPDGMTAREVQVLVLLSQGSTNAQIAQELVISESTVKTHINNLFAKARLQNRTQAVDYAYRHGLNRGRPA